MFPKTIRFGSFVHNLPSTLQHALVTITFARPDSCPEIIHARPLEMDYAICNGFGFAVVKASAWFRRWTDKLGGASTGEPGD